MGNIKWSIRLSLIACLTSFIFWVLLNLFNPYVNNIDWETMIRTFFMMVLPAGLGVVAAIKHKHGFMFVVFIWSLPMSVFFFLTPGIFSFYCIVSIAHFFSYLLMRRRLKLV